MPTNQSNIAMVRQRLGAPDPDKPSDPVLLNILLDQISNHCLELANTRNHWAVNSWEFTTSEGDEDYIVTATDFGRPFLIYTTDSTDTYHVRQEVPFSFLQDADQRYQGPQQTYSASQWSAATMSFYRLSPSTPSWYLRVSPIPGGTGTYVVWYEATYDTSAPSLGDAPGLSPFHHLIRVQTALSALPLCGWGDLSIRENAKGWAMQAEALRQGLAHDEARFQKQFNDYKANSSRDGVGEKLGYAPSYESGDGGGVGALVNGYGW